MSGWDKPGAILVTGGAGFVGSNLAISFKRAHPDRNVLALDNLKRRGSELNIRRLAAENIEFVHGDIRNPEDLAFAGRDIALIVECSAEPSVLAGFGGSPAYLLNSNLTGAINCFEAARLHRADVVFLSTSRVYPVRYLNDLNFIEEETRFSLATEQPFPGASANGISENFPLDAPRSLYGATKLAAELIAQEYAEMYDVRVIINRCGVIAGAWQMGKVDQGVFTLWMAAHYFGKSLKYIGFGGAGKQVRDVLHVDDLFDVLEIQLTQIDQFNGKIHNVGGGLANALSLQETTAICREITGNRIDIAADLQDRPADIKSYISDNAKISAACGWQPNRNPRQTLTDIFDWIRTNERELKPVLHG